jgi:hypothetical protein
VDVIEPGGGADEVRGKAATMYGLGVRMLKNLTWAQMLILGRRAALTKGSTGKADGLPAAGDHPPSATQRRFRMLIATSYVNAFAATA